MTSSTNKKYTYRHDLQIVDISFIVPHKGFFLTCNQDTYLRHRPPLTLSNDHNIQLRRYVNCYCPRPDDVRKDENNRSAFYPGCIGIGSRHDIGNE